MIVGKDAHGFSTWLVDNEYGNADLADYHGRCCQPAAMVAIPTELNSSRPWLPYMVAIHGCYPNGHMYHMWLKAVFGAHIAQRAHRCPRMQQGLERDGPMSILSLKIVPRAPRAGKITSSLS